MPARCAGRSCWRIQSLGPSLRVLECSQQRIHPADFCQPNGAPALPFGGLRQPHGEQAFGLKFIGYQNRLHSLVDRFNITWTIALPSILQLMAAFGGGPSPKKYYPFLLTVIFLGWWMVFLVFLKFVYKLFLYQPASYWGVSSLSSLSWQGIASLALSSHCWASYRDTNEWNGWWTELRMSLYLNQQYTYIYANLGNVIDISEFDPF